MNEEYLYRSLSLNSPHIEVWRAPTGGTASRMCMVDTGTIASGSKAYLITSASGTYSVDDFQMSAEDLSSTTYTYDTANQLTAMDVNGTTTNFTYDDWGRMSGKTQGSYAATYDYRFGDKLKAVTSSFPGEAPSVGYNYDGLGKRRVEQLGTSTLTWFRWLGWEESGEYTGTPGSWTIGAMQTGYVPGLAAFAGANPATAEWRYPLTDHLGSVRQLTAQNKAALARYDYTPYGELMRSSGLPLTVGYTGHRWDPAIGQYFAPFRYYNPQTTRWNMRDPLGFVDGPNLYAYVSARPMLDIDPYGLSWASAGRCFLRGAVTGAVGALLVGGIAVGAISIGAPVAVVTVSLGAVVLAGAIVTGLVIGRDIHRHNWDGLAHTAGSLLGGFAAGRGSSLVVRNGITPGDTTPFRLNAWSLRYRRNLGPVWGWLSTGPDQSGAMGATGMGGASMAMTTSGGC